MPGDDQGSNLTGDSFVPLDASQLKEQKRLLREQAVVPLERAFLINALDRNDWNVTRAAEEVGMQRPNFQAMLKKQGISVRSRCMD